jgi:pyruvate-ferredoxin/flavodoxin oxidoreductase
MPRLYSGCYGLGSRDLQPEALVAAVENMLEKGAHKKFFYLSIDFVRDQAANPKQEIHQQEILAAYPKIKDMALRGSENPNLMPKGAIAVRMHSVGGWGAVTTGKNLAMTLFELLGWDIKANPKYGSEKKGQPTTYYLSAAPEPIRVNCEYTHVDVVLSPDPNVFGHTNAVAGLSRGGVFIIQSNLPDAAALWASFPVHIQKYIIDNEIKVFYLDAFSIAREESSNPDLQLRMQGNAFQGAFFHASDIQQRSGLTEENLFKAIENQLKDKFGKKGQRVVDDNLRVVKRGYTEIHEIPAEVKKVGARQAPGAKAMPALPIMLKRMPENEGKLDKAADLHRFWEQTGNFYISGKGSDNLADPFMGMALMPAVTGVYRDMTQIRFEHPVWIAENCTACGNCYTQCPDSAIPGLVSTVADVLNTAVSNIEMSGRPTRFLRKGARNIEKKLRGVLDKDGLNVHALMRQAIEDAMHEDPNQGNAAMEEEYHLLEKEIGAFQFATTKPYWTNKEKKNKGSGGLFSITVNPYTCKGCALCVDVCDDDALKMVTQTQESIATLRSDWNFWLDLPTTPKEYDRIDDLEEKIGALETLLLDKKNYNSMACGDGACLGCGEKTSIHLFTSTVTALMQPRVKAFVEKLDGLDRRPGKASAHEADRVRGPVRHRRRDGRPWKPQGQGPDPGQPVGKPDGGPGRPPSTRWLRWVTQLLEKSEGPALALCEGPTGAAAPRWASSTPPAAPRCGAPPSPTAPILSPGPPTCSRTRPPWPWVCSKATWPRWRKASRPCAWPKSN